LNSSKEKHITKSTFLHKGCLPIPQLFGARKLFFVWGYPYKKEFRRYATAYSDFQKKWAEMNLQLNFWGEIYVLSMTNQGGLCSMTGQSRPGQG